MKSARTGFFAVLLITLFTAVAIVPAAEQNDGTIERIKVHGTSLEGNLEGTVPTGMLLSISLPAIARRRRSGIRSFTSSTDTASTSMPMSTF